MTTVHTHCLAALKRGLVLVCAMALIGTTGRAAALELAFPAPATLTASHREDLTSLRLPTGPFADHTLPTAAVEGALQIESFRLDLARASTLELMQSLREQIAAAGFSLQFECDTLACGGYDFRYGIKVLPEPDMHVDLGDFRYLAASRAGAKTAEHLGLLVSRFGQTGFVQLTVVGKTQLAPPPSGHKNNAPAHRPAAAVAPDGTGLLDGLAAGQSPALDDLVFASGSSTLASGNYASLRELGAWLRADPSRKIILVGHTDASGSLEGNLNLSKLRAESVRQELLSSQNIAANQIQAEGIGFLAPRESNQTPEGREKNRRVEVMLTPTTFGAP